MATCTLAAAISDTAAGPISSGAFTPAANDLLVCVVWGTGTSLVDTDLVISSTGNTAAWTRLGTGIIFETAGNNGRGAVFAQNALATAVSTDVTATFNVDNSTGNHIRIYRISGMTNTGVAALRQFAKDEVVASGTPQIAAFAAVCLTDNPVIVSVHDEGTADGWTPPTDWTESTTPDAEQQILTPTSRCDIAHRDSGFTGTTITWGSASTGAYSSVAVEFDASGGEPPPTGIFGYDIGMT